MGGNICIPFENYIPCSSPDIQCAFDWREEILEKPGCCLIHKHSISGFFVPPDLIKEKYPSTCERQLERLSRMRGIFERQASGDGWVEFLPTTLYDAVSINASCAVSGLELFAESGLTLQHEALRAALQIMKACLTRYPNYRIVWTPQPLPVSLWIKEGREALYCIEKKPELLSVRISPTSEQTPEPGLEQADEKDRGAFFLDELLESLSDATM
ncbi:MAG: hypothetical protein FWH04_00470 [Oscillospiraceae bacterium]|nr:hypothetical protein [Oscillospiraceae bacterium]